MAEAATLQGFPDDDRSVRQAAPQTLEQRLRVVQPDANTHDVQAASEGVVAEYDVVDFYGQKIRLAAAVSIMPMLAFANAGKRGLDSEDMEGLAAMYALIRSVVHRPPLLDDHGQRIVDESGQTLRDESEWARFEQIATDELAEGEDVMAFVNAAMEVMSARPTRRREISSGGSPRTSERSKAGSSLLASDPRMQGMTPVSEL